MSSEKQIEQEIQAKGLTAPRVTPDHIESCIVGEFYFTAADGYRNSPCYDPTGHPYEPLPAPAALELLTFCVLVLKNGFTVTGESACASPENFDAEIGRKIARANAREKIWLLEGYALKQRLYENQISDDALFVGGLRQDGTIEPVAETTLQPHQKRVVDEKEQLGERLGKLSDFLMKGKPDFIDDAEWQRLNDQHMHMNEYHEILIDRINHF